MAIAFPGESAEYRAARDRLQEQEIELRRAMETVATARRRLPPGGIVPQDYVFHGQGPGDGPAEVRLYVFHCVGDTIRHFWGSELFYAKGPGQDPRHVGTLEPAWNLYDLIPEGRGTDWDKQLSY